MLRHAASLVPRGAAATLLRAPAALSANAPSRGKASLPDLPYDYGALEPVISAEIMTLHHSKHHQTYVNNYNAAAEKLQEACAKGTYAAISDTRLFRFSSLLHFRRRERPDLPSGRHPLQRGRAPQPLHLLEQPLPEGAVGRAGGGAAQGAGGGGFTKRRLLLRYI